MSVPVPISIKLHRYNQEISTGSSREVLTTTRIMAIAMTIIVTEKTLNKMSFFVKVMRVFQRMSTGIDKTEESKGPN